jgi:hypothetical protein
MTNARRIQAADPGMDFPPFDAPSREFLYQEFTPYAYFVNGFTDTMTKRYEHFRRLGIL